MSNLMQKIIEKEAKIGILGLGHTGLSQARDFAHAGYHVIGYDIDTKKIEMLNRGESYLPFLSFPHILHLIQENHFYPTTDPDKLKEADVLIVAVPTPLNEERMPDLNLLKNAAKLCGKVLHKDELVVIQSTSFPGTTEEILRPIIEKESGLKVGQDFNLSYVPEREDPSSSVAIMTQIPRICGGVTPECTELTRNLYNHVSVKVHICSAPRVAEAAKTFENSFRLVNIAFADEMKVAFDKMGISLWEVIEACSTKPFGYTPFYPGPGIGGECIPVDPIYLSERAKDHNAVTEMIDLAARINLQTHEYVASQIEKALKERSKSLKGSKVLFLGVAYKKDVGDIRESPVFRIFPILKEKGAEVAYNDPYVPFLQKFQMESVPLTDQKLSEYDCVVIITDHSRYDWKKICENSQLIIDTRNATKSLPYEYKKEKVIL